MKESSPLIRLTIAIYFQMIPLCHHQPELLQLTLDSSQLSICLLLAGYTAPIYTYKQVYLRNHSLAFRIISTGHVGFEPTSYGVKVRCLSAWRMPYDLYLIFFNWKILAESLEITLDYLSKIMYITSESVSALQIFYPFGYRFVCMYQIRPSSKVRQHRLYDVDGSFVCLNLIYYQNIRLSIVFRTPVLIFIIRPILSP